MTRFGATLLAVALGSALGAVARAGLHIALDSGGGGWPWSTWLANVAGSFAIVFVATLSAPDGKLLLSPLARQGFMAGFCGGFTTFSIFSLEALTLWSSGAQWLAASYVMTSVLAWLFAAWLGNVAGNACCSRR